MKAYSTDLRQRIVDAYKKGEGSVRELAQRFVVAYKTVQNYLNLERETGSVEPRPHGGGPTPKLDDASVQEMRAIVAEKTDRTLDEIAKEMGVRNMAYVGRTTVWRTLDRLSLTRKKNRTSKRAGPTRRSAGA